MLAWYRRNELGGAGWIVAACGDRAHGYLAAHWSYDDPQKSELRARDGEAGQHRSAGERSVEHRVRGAITQTLQRRHLHRRRPILRRKYSLRLVPRLLLLRSLRHLPGPLLTGQARILLRLRRLHP